MLLSWKANLVIATLTLACVILHFGERQDNPPGLKWTELPELRPIAWGTVITIVTALGVAWSMLLWKISMLRREAERMLALFKNQIRETGNTTPESELIKQRLESAQRRLSWSGRLPHEEN
jgi:hypothetical protein